MIRKLNLSWLIFYLLIIKKKILINTKNIIVRDNGEKFPGNFHAIFINICSSVSHPSIFSEFTPRYQWGLCFSIFSFMCMFCRSLFVPLYFFLWPLCCLFFFDIRILITPLVSSKFKIKFYNLFIVWSKNITLN